MKRENKERVYKVMYVKQKNGSYTARIIVPYSLLKDLNIKIGDSVQYTPCEKGIIIRRYSDD